MAATHTPKPLDPKDIFWNGARFEVAALIVSRTEGHAIEPREAEDRARLMLNAPRAVLSVFSLELYLKCLLLIETGAVPRSHRIAGLFSKVSKPRQKVIADFYYEEQTKLANPPGKPKRPFGQAFLPNGQVVPVLIGYIEEHISVTLKSADRAFEEWRYAHEGVTTSQLYNGQALRIAVRRCLLDIMPAWSSILDELFVAFPH